MPDGAVPGGTMPEEDEGLVRILVINPNTSQAMTAAVLARARSVSGGAATFEGATAARGVSVVASRASYAVAALGTLEAWAARGGRCDAVLVACFGDPGVAALRELAHVPVFGLAEAAMQAAAARHRRFAVVTAGPCWPQMIDELAAVVGIAGYAGTFAVEATGLQLRSDPSRFDDGLVAAVARAAAAGAEAILLGGAAFADMPRRIPSPVPLLDCIDLALARMAAGSPPSAGPAAPPVATTGLDPALAALLAGPGAWSPGR